MKRIQRQRTKGWRMPEGAVYVGRPTMWGNPWVVGDVVGFDADSPYRSIGNGAAITPWLAVELYRAALYSPPMVGRTMAGLGYGPETVVAMLYDATALVCWCHLCDEHAEGKPAGVACDRCQPCHADVLVEIVLEAAP